MNLEILKKLNFFKILKITTVFAALSLVLVIIFYSNETAATNYLGLPACSTVANPSHRVNCNDLIDLPLCDDLRDETSVTVTNLSNCIEECKTIATNPDTTKVRGRDYAVHGINCIRFCDTLSGAESGFTQSLSVGVNCVRRKCHQLPAGTAATDLNCSMSKCNLLTAAELHNPRFVFDATNYDPDTVPAMPDPPRFCDGTDVKCYSFTQDKLPYVKVWPKNSMCQLHNCKPSPASCTVPDDTLNISGNTSTLGGKTYEQDYVKYINNNLSLADRTACVPVRCPIITIRPFACGGDDGDVRNTSCDAAGTPGGTCTGGTCYKTIDCNLAANQLAIECVSDRAAAGAGDISPDDTDVMNSWFYRPTPMEKATEENEAGQRVLRTMSTDLCYTSSQFKAQGWGEKIFLLGYFHLGYGFTGESRSPGRCMSDWGIRNSGYLALCGTKGLITNAPHSYTAYHSGYVVSQFSGDEITHRLNVCVRFNNTARLYDPASKSEVCGRRECDVTALFGSWSGQVCGGDLCRELVVKESNQKECQYNDENTSLFTSDNRSKGCVAVLGNEGSLNGYLRLRAVKYGNRICTFLDVKGLLAYNGMFMNGNEIINEDGTCLSGRKGSDGTCQHTKNSNDSKTTADKWRAILQIPYIGDNQKDDDINGYLNQAGEFFEAQQCIKTEVRIAPPMLYNLANQINSPRLFMPPLFISDSFVKQGGVSAPLESDGSPGATDFNYPEIEVTFGSQIKKLSLDLGYNGNEIGSDVDPKSVATLIARGSESINYTVEIFIKKDVDTSNNLPLLCLYRKLYDENDSPLEPMRIQCVKRLTPEINDTLKKQGISISREAVANNLNNSKIVLKYVADYGANSVNNNCDSGQDDTCSTAITLTSPSAGTETCSSSTESYKVCAKRDECTKLRIECLQNEVSLQAAKTSNSNTTPFLTYRNYCNNILLPYCAGKKGATIPSNSSVTDIDPFDNTTMPGTTNAYGLFSEICLTKGFEKKLDKIIAYQLSDGIMGKCSSTCVAGGNKKLGCPCVKYVEGDEVPAGMMVRLETPREAGLCIDIPKTQLCSAIDYNTSPGSPPDNTEYVASSIDKFSSDGYGSAGVHETHKLRTEGTSSGHAEFPAIVPGTVDVEGDCVGFWKYETDSVGTPQKPKRNCQFGSAGAAPSWTTVSNSCARYTCQAISAPDDGSDSNNNYPPMYSSGETGDNVGLSNGYANWSSHLQTSDFMEVQTASSCIPGFKAMGATAVSSGGVITGYDNSNATLPQRYCNQIGTYYPPTASGKNPKATTANPNAANQCERITCPAIDPTDPRTLTANSAPYWAAWAEWEASKGATFGVSYSTNGSKILTATKASRSKNYYAGESVATGTCNNALGFFNAVNGNRPTRQCDYLGNWGEVTDPCVTSCDAVDATAGATANNGFATWAQVVDVPISGKKSATASACLPGYVKYPYVPRKSDEGAVIAGTTYSEPTGFVASNPVRTCKSVVTAGGSANVWTAPNSTCIDACPGETTDPRISVGLTTHPTSTGTVSVSWDEGTELGLDQYQSSCSGVGAESYLEGRANRCYLLRRHCNANGKWDDPIPSCVALYDAGGSGSLIGNARYEVIGLAKGLTNSLPALSAINSSLDKATGTCITNFWPDDSTTNGFTSTEGDDYPLMQCVYQTGNTYIDKVYWKLLNNDCKKIQCPSVTITETTANASRIKNTTITAGNVGDTKTIDCDDNTQHFGTTFPTVTCQADGTWSAVTNDSTCQSPCTTVYEANELDANGCSDGEWWSVPVTTMRHGEAISFNAHSTCGGDCVSWRYGATCNNGTVSKVSIVSWAYGDRKGACQSWDYVPASNTFTGPVNGTHSDTSDHQDLNYIDNTGTSRTVTLGHWDD